MTGKSIIFQHIVYIISFRQQFHLLSKILLILDANQKWTEFDILEFIITTLCIDDFHGTILAFSEKINQLIEMN